MGGAALNIGPDAVRNIAEPNALPLAEHEVLSFAAIAKCALTVKYVWQFEVYRFLSPSMGTDDAWFS